MAGIGFSLKRLFGKKGILNLCKAYGYAGIVTTGICLSSSGQSSVFGEDNVKVRRPRNDTEKKKTEHFNLTGVFLIGLAFCMLMALLVRVQGKLSYSVRKENLSLPSKEELIALKNENRGFYFPAKPDRTADFDHRGNPGQPRNL